MNLLEKENWENLRQHAPVQLVDINLVGGQPQLPVLPDKIKLFRALLRQGSVAPPLWVRRHPGGRYLVLDGLHRLLAAKAEGVQSINVVRGRGP
jgi:ParB-like chromosome segregation protein Spo0J